MQPHCAHSDGRLLKITLIVWKNLILQMRQSIKNIWMCVCLDLLLLHASTTEPIFAEMWNGDRHTRI